MFSSPDAILRSHRALRPLCCALLAALASTVLADETSHPPRDSIAGLLVLRNGSVMSGQISREGDRFRVVDENSQIWIGEDRIAFFCRSLEEAYQTKRARLEDLTAAGHLKLADWCIRYELFPQAAREILDARRLNPAHPRLAVLDRRLRVAMLPSHVPQTLANNATEAALEPRPQDHSTHDLPKEVIEAFVRRVQPLLVTNCTAGGCHSGDATTGFAINRHVRRGTATRRQTMSNLNTILSYVDRDEPEASLLVTAASDPAGPHGRAIFDRRNESARRQLIDWLWLVAEAERETLEAVLHADAVQGGRVPAVMRGGSAVADRPVYTDQRVKSAVYADRRGRGPQRGAVPKSMAQLRRPNPKVQVGVRLRRVRPQDALDPEEFNRQFSPNEDVDDESAGNDP